MATIMDTAQAQPAPWVPEVRKRLLTVAEYQRMAEIGILSARERTELIEGEIYEMTPIGNRHVWLVSLIGSALRGMIGPEQWVIEQGALQIGEHTQVQPDVMLLRSRPKSLNDPLPVPMDVLLLVEVADSTLDFDRGAKLAVYARNGIQEFWIVDVEAKAIEVYREPSGDRYAKVSRSISPEKISPLGSTGSGVDLAAIFR